MKRTVTAAVASIAVVSLSACSQETQDDAARTADLAGDDIEANAEVVGNEIREGAIVATEEISEGAERLSEDLSKADANDPDPGDGQLDGAD